MNTHSDDGDYDTHRDAGIASVYNADTFLDPKDIIINRVK